MFRLLGKSVATPFRGSTPRIAVAAVHFTSPPSYCYSTEEDFELDYRKMFEVHNLRVLPEDVKKQQAAKYHNNFKELFFDPRLTKEVKVARTEREWFNFRRQYEKPILKSLYQAHQEKKELVRQEKKKIHKMIEEVRAPQKSRGIFEKRYLQAVDYFESTILSEKSNAHLKIDLTNLERPPEEILAESQNLLLTSQYMEKQQQSWFKAMTNAYCHMSENDIFAIGGITPFNYTLENRVVIEELVDMEVDAVGLQEGALIYTRKRSMQKYAKGEVDSEMDEESKRKLAEVAATVASIPKPAPMTEEEQLFGRVDRKGAAASRDEDGEREEPEAEFEEAVNLSPKGISNFFKGDAKANPTRIGEADQFASELIENMDDRGAGDLMMEQDIPGEGESAKKSSGEAGRGGIGSGIGSGPGIGAAPVQPTRSPLAFKQESTAIHDTDTVEYEKVLDDLTPEAKTRISILFDIRKEEVAQLALHRVTREEMKKYGLPLCDDPGLRPVDKFLVADGVSDEIKYTDEMNQIDEDSLTKEDKQLLSELQGRIRKKQAEVQRLRKLAKVQHPLDWQSADMVGDGPNVGVVDLELQAQRELDAIEQALHEKLVARGVRLPDEKNGTWGLGLTYRSNNRRHRLFRSPQADVEFIRYRYFQPSLQAKRRLKMYERKVKMRVRLASFNLPECVLDRIGELVGHLRYHAGQKILTITADQFPNQHQNTLHCIHVLQQLLNNAMQVMPLYVPFSDLEADINSIMESKPVSIPEVTPVDDADPRDSILVERSAFLTKKHNLAPTDYLTPLERQAKRAEEEAALGTSLSSDPSSDRFTLFRFSWDPFVNRQSAQSSL